MKNSRTNFLALAAFAVMVGFFANTSAQGQGFDPAQFRQRQLDGYREQLDVKSDEDWNKIEPLITKVMDAQRDARMGAGFGFGRGGRGRGGDQGGNSDQSGNTNRNRNRFGGPPNPAIEALQKAIDDKASGDELKTKLAKFRDSRKEKEAAVAKAPDEL